MGPETAFVIGAMLGAGSVLALRQFWKWVMAEDVMVVAGWQRQEAERQAEFEDRVAQAAATRERIYATYRLGQELDEDRRLAASRLHMEPLKFIPEPQDGLRITPRPHGPRY